MAKNLIPAAPHPNRFSAYLKQRGLSRMEILNDGTFNRHFRAWGRQVRQRIALKSLASVTRAIQPTTKPL